MSENPTPVAAPAAEPVIQSEATPEVNAPESSSEPVATEAAKTETKADIAADKTGAEKVSEDKYELKVDGETLVLNKAEMIKYAQLGKAGQKRMQEAAEREKKAIEKEEFVKSNVQKLYEQLKNDPESILEDENIGHNKYELAKKWLAEKLENDAKSPEQKKLEEALAKSAALEKQIAEIEKQKQEEIRRKEEENENREMEANIKMMETEMLTAFKKYGLPNSSAMIDRMVGLKELAARHGVDVSIDDVAKVARDEIRKDIQELAQMLPDDQFEELLGDVGIKKIKDSTLKKMKHAPKVDAPELAKVSKNQVKEKPKMSIKDWTKPDWAK